jgi:hypothetical protein
LVKAAIIKGRNVPTVKAGFKTFPDNAQLDTILHDMMRSKKPSCYMVPKSLLTKANEAGFTSQSKWLKKHCKEEGLTTANSKFKPMAQKKIFNSWKKTYPEIETIAPALSEEQAGFTMLAQAVFGVKQFLVQDTHFSLMPPLYGTYEFRVLFEGQYWILGLPLDKVPGESLGAKIAWSEVKALSID